jgi:hypothetical protein
MIWLTDLLQYNWCFLIVEYSFSEMFPECGSFLVWRKEISRNESKMIFNLIQLKKKSMESKLEDLRKILRNGWYRFLLKKSRV